MSFHNHDPEDPQGWIKGRNEQIRKEKAKSSSPEIPDSSEKKEPKDFWKGAIYHIDGAEYNVDEEKLTAAFHKFADFKKFSLYPPSPPTVAGTSTAWQIQKDEEKTTVYKNGKAIYPVAININGKTAFVLDNQLHVICNNCDKVFKYDELETHECSNKYDPPLISETSTEQNVVVIKTGQLIEVEGNIFTFGKDKDGNIIPLSISKYGPVTWRV